jgi:hypothetical protein
MGTLCAPDNRTAIVLSAAAADPAHFGGVNCKFERLFFGYLAL